MISNQLKLSIHNSVIERKYRKSSSTASRLLRDSLSKAHTLPLVTYLGLNSTVAFKYLNFMRVSEEDLVYKRLLCTGCYQNPKNTVHELRTEIRMKTE